MTQELLYNHDLYVTPKPVNQLSLSFLLVHNDPSFNLSWVSMSKELTPKPNPLKLRGKLLSLQLPKIERKIQHIL